MLHKKVTYTNYNGEVVNEDVYFNLTSVELIRLEAKYGNLWRTFLQDQSVRNSLAEFL